MMGPVSDNFLRDILTTTKTIVMVGLSMNETRPSYFVGRYLHRRGYKIIPVNAGHGGKHFFGQMVMSSIDEISEPVDMVDIFRKPEAVPQIVDDSLVKLQGLKTIWMQIGIKHEISAQKAKNLGLNVIEDRCPKIEHQRLFGELRKAGFATKIISSRL
jgi:predicted CoA-binding protein